MENEFTTGGLVFMLSSWAVIIALCVFCFIKVFSKKK